MLSAVHPLTKLAVCLAWIAAAILVFDPLFQALAILISAASLLILERRSPLLVLALMLPFALFGFGFLTTSILFRQESDFALRMAGETPFGSPAVSAGIVLFLRAVACGMLSAVFVLTTDPGAFVKALMVNCRLSPRIGYALFSAMQLVPDLAIEAQQIRLARAVRRGHPPRRLPGPVETASLVVPLLAFAIRRAGRAALAMEARGLGASNRRTVISAPRFTWADPTFAMISALALAGAVWLVQAARIWAAI